MSSILLASVHHNFPDAFELGTSWNACKIGDRVQIDVEHKPQVMSPAQLDARLDKLYEIGTNAVQLMFDHHGIELEFEFAEIRVECCHAWTVSEPLASSG